MILLGESFEEDDELLGFSSDSSSVEEEYSSTTSPMDSSSSTFVIVNWFDRFFSLRMFSLLVKYLLMILLGAVCGCYEPKSSEKMLFLLSFVLFRSVARLSCSKEPF